MGKCDHLSHSTIRRGGSYSVGTNYLYERCSREAIVSGIINLAQQVHPSASVVLHALLLRGADRFDRNWWWKRIVKINERLQ